MSRGARLIAAGASRNVRLWSLTSVQEARRDNCDDAIHPDGLVLEDELSLNAEVVYWASEGVNLLLGVKYLYSLGFQN